MPLRKIATVALAALCAAACASIASAADLKVGDPAPALKPGKWIKGEPVTAFDKDKVYVVEFWATWCGPCRESIPHLSQMQGKYKDVVFIGQDVWERDAAQSKSEDFVKEMGDKMNYRVALDDRADGGKGAMAETWMEAAGQNGIPTAFVVNKGGTIAWIGHPMELEPVLEKVVAGKYDLEEAKKDAQAKADAESEQEAISNEFQTKVMKPLQSGDAKGAAAAIDELIASHPKMKMQLLGAKFGVLLQGNEYDEAYKTADQLAEASNDNAQQLNALAWTIVDNDKIKQKDFDRAEKYAKRAAELTNEKDAAILDTLARCYAEKNQYDKAVEIQTKAVAAADGDMKDELQKTLDGYKTKVAK